MRAVVQRVQTATVSVAGEIVGRLTEPGLVALVGVTSGDGPEVADRLAGKLAGLRILRGDRSASEVGAGVMVVSQFTLYADTGRGRRPSWNAAAPAAVAEPVVDAVVRGLRSRGVPVVTGRFGADMQVELINDGPVTLLLEL